ncbi:hypothetical protein KFL_002870140 [Klebsormidium nitens]|uniref:SMP-30/Gluconolactonase/LRE-like region domain-containing protein n=1 Tax=Klebsormidium nitens TaxID=105231 RepID=A0A1Y1I627_KLENI|nr:hypothetical protein KFL_002870140 [Klebsormidium nitens]|eukprot:GAQ86410.1 hypothetical protein KFL_002870140 [Klebsormidium nitens]
MAPERITYTAPQQFPESIDWDAKHQRFLVGSVLRGNVMGVYQDGTAKELVKDMEYKGCGTLGITVDAPRNRVVVTIKSNAPAPNYNAVAGYDLHSGERLFLTPLNDVPCSNPPREMPVFANDSAVDPKTGEIYTTDTHRSLIWKCKADGSDPVVFAASPLFESFPTVFEMFPLGLNGLVVHENGYIITFNLRQGVGFKVPLDGSEPSHIAIDGVFPGADGIRLRPDGRLVVTTNDNVYLVESSDEWRSAKILETVPQDPTISTTAVAIKDGRAYINYAWFAEAYGGKQRSEFYMQTADFEIDRAEK